MVNLLGREALLVLLVGLLAVFYIPPLVIGRVGDTGLFLVGLVMGLTFMAIYAMAVLLGNKIPGKWRHWFGAFAWVGTFANDLFLYVGLRRGGYVVEPTATYLALSPGLLVVLLMVLTALRSPRVERSGALMDTLYAYSLPMLTIRNLLIPLAGGGLLVTNMVLQLGAFYTGARVLVRIFWPGSVDGNLTAPLLVQRYIPDAVVGLVEGTARRRARPYATGQHGELDETVVSILCRPEEAPVLVEQLNAVLADRPFQVSPGQTVSGQLELVIRPRAKS
jgi:hypothetical protein